MKYLVTRKLLEKKTRAKIWLYDLEENLYQKLEIVSEIRDCIQDTVLRTDTMTRGCDLTIARDIYRTSGRRKDKFEKLCIP